MKTRMAGCLAAIVLLAGCSGGGDGGGTVVELIHQQVPQNGGTFVIDRAVNEGHFDIGYRSEEFQLPVRVDVYLSIDEDLDTEEDQINFYSATADFGESGDYLDEGTECSFDERGIGCSEDGTTWLIDINELIEQAGGLPASLNLIVRLCQTESMVDCQAFPFLAELADSGS